MKKILILGLLASARGAAAKFTGTLAAALIVLAACDRGGEDGDPWIEPTEPPILLEGTHFPYLFKADYYGAEHYGEGTGNFWIGFGTTDFIADDAGFEIYFDIITPEVDAPASQQWLDIPSGTYPIDGTQEVGTVFNYMNTYMTDWQGDSGATVVITGGTVQIAGNHDDCTVAFSLQTDRGTFKGYYKGPIRIQNPAAPSSPFEGDQALGALKIHGGVQYNPDVFGDNGDVDNYSVMALSEGVSVVGSQLSGTGWALGYLNFFAPLGSGATIPDGTYTIDYSTEAGYVTHGYLDINPNTGHNIPYGLWVRRLDGGKATNAAIVSGTVTSVCSEGHYTITVAGKDDKGNNITATITD